ncbi:MAG: class I SAM-dependent methyltransferase [Promethearchaeia archaeon]
MTHKHKMHEWTEERSKRFIKSVENKIEKRYAPFAKEIYNFMIQFHINENSRILDIGCGPGFLLFELQNLAPDIEIVGVDSSELMIETASKKAKEKKIRKFEFKKGYAENLPIVDNSFGVITCFNSLHDFKDMQRPIEESFRVLRKTGILVLQDRSGTYPKWKFISVVFRIGLRNAWRYFKTRYSWLDPKVVEKWMIEAGFQILILKKKEHYIIVGKK